VSERLTDTEIDVALKAACECRPLDTARESHSHDCDTLYFRALAELRERRARDLSAEDREALSWLRAWDSLDGHAPRSETGSATHGRALTALDKVLARGGGR
jgi:hypothetical protein